MVMMMVVMCPSRMTLSRTCKLALDVVWCLLPCSSSSSSSSSSLDDLIYDLNLNLKSEIGKLKKLRLFDIVI